MCDASIAGMASRRLSSRTLFRRSSIPLLSSILLLSGAALTACDSPLDCEGDACSGTSTGEGGGGGTTTTTSSTSSTSSTGEEEQPCTVDAAFDRFVDIPPALQPPFDPAAEIHVHGHDDEVAARQILIDAGWGETLPTSVPLDVTPALEDLEGLSEPESVEAWQSSYGTLIYVLSPEVPNGRAVIVHQGHASYEARWSGGVGTLIDHLLAQGFTVAAMQMPLRGWNTGEWDSHAEIIADLGDAALAQFVGPVIEVVNRLEDEFEDISMVGLSGGGWTTVLAAAIDVRIKRSAPVAGSLPIRFRDAYKEKVCAYFAGDEQDDFSFYDAWTYEDLYVLGASAGRRQVQINNQYDPCCFYGMSSSLYAPLVSEAASGAWGFHLDSSHKSHKISEEARGVIDALLSP